MKLHTALTLPLLAAIAQAGPRTSANYAIATDASDTGGNRATSAAYTNDGSAGLFSGISAVASPAETAKHGYIAQLYDPSALQLSASPLTINENTIRQFSASLLLDDATTLDVAASSVAWSILSGPLTSISSSGLATAGVVYQDTAASVQGVNGGLTGMLSLTVLDTATDNFGAYAGDGLNDAWQVQYFGVGSANAGPLLDPDHDGWINLFEYNAGLVPTDPQSAFAFREETVPNQPNQRRIIFSPRLPGRTYNVMSSTTGAAGTWQPLTGAITTDNGSERTVTDTNASAGRKFYRIEVQAP